MKTIHHNVDICVGDGGLAGLCAAVAAARRSHHRTAAVAAALLRCKLKAWGKGFRREKWKHIDAWQSCLFAWYTLNSCNVKHNIMISSQCDPRSET